MWPNGKAHIDGIGKCAIGDSQITWPGPAAIFSYDLGKL